MDFCAKNCYDSAIKAKEARSWTTNSARASAHCAWCAVQHFTAEPFIPEEPVPPNAIIGYADTTTYIYTVSKLPTYLFWGALLLFAVGIGVLLAPKIKKWKGKTHDR